MNPAVRHLLVIVLSFAVIAGSGIATYATWFALPGLATVERAAISLSSWVAAFYVGTFLFWRTVLAVSRFN